MLRNGQERNQQIQIYLKNLETINKNAVEFKTEKGEITLYFSYETIVSFEAHTENEFSKATIKNYWGQTTGKLLNELEQDKTKRLEREDFKKALNKALKGVF